MTRYFFILFLTICFCCVAQKSIIHDHVTIAVSTYESEGKTKASAMPEIKTDSKLSKYQRRFDYLLMNYAEIHLPEKAKERNEIFDLYPQEEKLKKRYLEKYATDKKLVGYFKEAVAPFNNPNQKITKVYTQEELMTVASKFFYCDRINPDTTVQSHVCIGINGIKETKWDKDYTLLAAFCFEAIFADFEKDTSQIEGVYALEKKAACEQQRKNISTLDKYLQDVKLDLFARMKNSAVLKEQLLAYYERNKMNLAFRIEK